MTTCCIFHMMLVFFSANEGWCLLNDRLGDELRSNKLSFYYDPITIVFLCIVPFSLSCSICCPSHLNIIFLDCQGQVTPLLLQSSFYSVSSTSTSQATSEAISRKRYAANSMGKGSIPVSRPAAFEDPDVWMVGGIICVGGTRGPRASSGSTRYKAKRRPVCGSDQKWCQEKARNFVFIWLCTCSLSHNEIAAIEGSR